jgi:omega-6 fatty acid desaturase (delta-12 desaturase)
MCLRSFLSNKKKHWDSLLVIIIHVGIAVFLFATRGWDTWLLTFFVPFFISHMIGAYLFFAQHNFPGVKYRNNTEWNYVTAALESSSFIPMNPFMQWVTANIGYHHIHHLNAKIPFYRLPEAMANIPELQCATVTRLTFTDIVACLKLKVWDPELDRMIDAEELKKYTQAA